MAKQGGFTIIELLAVITIAGILSAIAYLSFQSQRDRAQYAAALQMMGGKISLLEEYRLTSGRYPGDRLPNQVPEGIAEWLPTDSNQIPFNSSFDWDHWGVGAGRCLARITFFGKNRIRDTPAYQAGKARGDDVAIDLRLYACEESTGSID